MVKIFIPTYNRKTFNALHLLNDENVKLMLCVRHSMIINNYYKELLNKYDRIELVDIGEPNEIGQTRENILKYCQNKKIKYCVMLDDTISNIRDVTDETLTISQCINKCIQQMQTNLFSDLSVLFALSTPKRNHHGSLSQEYFYHCPAQGFIIDTELCKQHDVHFLNMSICGSEDMAFFIDTIRAGLITCTNPKIVMIGDMPMKSKVGGTHVENDNTIEKRNDKFITGLKKYVGDMYGVYFTKRYRHGLKEYVCFTAFDYDYFYDVLIRYRSENEQIIKSRFKVKFEEE